MLKQQNNIVWSLISLNNAHAMSWKVHCFIQQYLLFALNEAICQFLSKFDIYPISIWRNFFQFEFVRKFVYSIFYYHTSTGLYEQNFLCYRSHEGSSLKVPGLTHCALVVPWAIKILGPYFNVAVEAIGPKTDFTLETTIKKWKKNHQKLFKTVNSTSWTLSSRP